MNSKSKTCTIPTLLHTCFILVIGTNILFNQLTNAQNAEVKKPPVTRVEWFEIQFMALKLLILTAGWKIRKVPKPVTGSKLRIIISIACWMDYLIGK